MARFQKRPVEIEAEVVEEETEIETREGTLYAYPGDLLITGVEGEVYPCDPEIFLKTYVPASTNGEGWEAAREVFRELKPEGVNMRFTTDLVDGEEVTVLSDAWVEEDADLTEEQEEAAVRFLDGVDV